MNIKTKIRTFPIIPKKNIGIPIGSILAVQYFYEKPSFHDIFSKEPVSKLHPILLNQDFGVENRKQ